MSRVLLCLILASSPAAGVQLPEVRPSGAPQASTVETRPLRLIDATGRPLPEFTRVELRTEWYLLEQPADARNLMAMNDEMFVEHLVGADGQIVWVRSRSGPRHYRGFLHARPVGSAEPRRRAFVPWPVEASSDAPIELKLEPERVLCSGKLVDELGKPVAFDSLYVRIQDSRPKPLLDPMRLLDAKVKSVEDGYAILGWPHDGPWQISAMYIYRGPESAPRAVDFKTTEIDLILPSTGHVQTRAKLPDPCPSGALEAVYTHVSTGEIVRQPVHDRTTNHRLRAGAQRMRVELAGKPLLDLGEVQVPGGGQLDVALPLPETLRVLRISVFDLEGKPIPAVQARIQGGNDEFHFNNDAGLGAILVMTARASLDLTIESQGFEPLRLSGVDGDRRVELKRSWR